MSQIAPTIRTAFCSSGLLIARASIIGVMPSVQSIPAPLERADHVDVDEVDTEWLVADAGFLEVVEERVGELAHLVSPTPDPPHP